MIRNYQLGGALPPDDPHYVERQADQKLFQSLIRGEFCYVFNSRQTGKSSLQIQVRKKLEAQDILCTYIDLSGIDTQINREDWYFTIVYEVVRDLIPDFDVFDWWDEIPSLNVLAKFSKFFEQVLFPRVKGNIIIFIDEIDAVLSLNFDTDSFFRFIRSCYNRRAVNLEYKRLSFCLLGVTDPSYLIEDKQNTPFNIGTAIELKGFTFEEAKQPLTRGLEEKLDFPQTVLEEILDWTGGQPFLTVKILQLLIEKTSNRKPNINQLVKTYLLENWESQDHPEHLKTIRDRLLFRKHLAQKILTLYQDILHKQNKNKKIKADDSNREDAKIELLLSGLVVKKNGYLVVNNKIYQRIFNLNWINNELTKLLSKTRPEWYVKKLTHWLNSNRKDKSILLTTEELISFQQWTLDDKRLNKEDLGFLYQSAKQIEKKAQIAKQQALKAKLQATEEKKSAYKIIAGLTGLTMLIIMSVFGFFGYQQKQEKLNQITDKLVKSAELESQHNLEGSILLYAEALKRKPSLFLKLDFYQQLALLAPAIYNCQLQNDDSQDSILSNLVFNANGNFLVKANLDGVAQLWDISKFLNQTQGNLTRKCSSLVKSMNHQDGISAVALSADNKYFATVSNDNKVRIFEQNTDTPIILPLPAQETILAMEFSPDNKYLVTGNLEQIVTVWDISTSKIVNSLKLKSGVNDIAFHPKGEFMAIATNTSIKLWNFRNNQSQQLNHQFNNFSVNFSPDGNYLALGSADNTARIWNISQIWQSSQDNVDSLTASKIFKHQSKVNAVKFSLDSKYLLTGSDENTGKLWSVEKGNLINQTFHRTPVIDVAFLNTGQVITASWDDRVKIWESLAGRVVKSLSSDQVWQNLVFDLKNDYVVTQDRENNLQILNLNTGHLNSLISLDVSSGQNLDSIYLSPQGNYIAIINDHIVEIWQKIKETKWRKIQTFHHPDTVHQLIINRDENYLVTLCDDWKVRLWNLNDTMKFEDAQIVMEKKKVESVVFTGSNNYLAVIDEHIQDQSFSLRKLPASKQNPHIKEIALPKELTKIKNIIFAKNQPFFVTINNQNNLCIWSIDNLNKVKCQFFPKNFDNILQFNENGDFFATISNHKILEVWQSNTLNKEVRIPHEDNIKRFIFSSDGKYVATITVKNQIQVWQINQCKSIFSQFSCQPILNFSQQDNIQEIVFRNDGKNDYFVLALPKDIMQIRLNNLKDFVEKEICPLLSRNLTRKEWEKYLEDEPYRPTCNNTTLPLIEETGELHFDGLFAACSLLPPRSKYTINFAQVLNSSFSILNSEFCYIN